MSGPMRILDTGPMSARRNIAMTAARLALAALKLRRAAKESRAEGRRGP